MYPPELKLVLTKLKGVRAAVECEEQPPHRLTFLMGELTDAVIEICETLGAAGVAINSVAAETGRSPKNG